MARTDEQKHHQESSLQRDQIILMLDLLIKSDTEKKQQDEQHQKTNASFSRDLMDNTSKSLRKVTSDLSMSIAGLDTNQITNTENVVNAINGLNNKISKLLSEQQVKMADLKPLREQVFTDWSSTFDQVNQANRAIDQRDKIKAQKDEKKFLSRVIGNVVTATDKGTRAITQQILRTAMMSTLFSGLQTALGLPLKALSTAVSALGAVKFLGGKSVDLIKVVLSKLGLDKGKLNIDLKEVFGKGSKGITATIGRTLMSFMGKAAFRVASLLNPLTAIATLAWTGYEIYSLFEDEFKQAWNFLAAKVPEWLGVIKTVFLELLDSGVVTLKTLFNNALSSVSELMDEGSAVLNEWLASTGIKEFYQTVVNQLTSIWAGITSVFFNIPNYLKLMWYKLVDFQITLQEGMNEKVNGLSNFVNAALKEVGSDLRVPEIEIFDVKTKRDELNRNIQATQDKINSQLTPQVDKTITNPVEVDLKPPTPVIDDIPTSNMVNEIITSMENASSVFASKLDEQVKHFSPMLDPSFNQKLEPSQKPTYEASLKHHGNTVDMAKMNNNSNTFVAPVSNTSSTTTVTNPITMLYPMRTGGESQTTRPSTANRGTSL